MTPAGWSLGVYIGLPVTILFVLVGLAVIVGGWWTRDPELRAGGFIFGGLVLVGTLLIAGISFWPWSPSFHRWYHVQGVVQSVGSRQIADGKGMSTRYVFQIDGQAFGVDDTRAALTKVGDRVSLLCKREWVYQSVPGWACNWDQ